MAEPNREPRWQPLRPDSPHSVNLDLDGPGDNTVRPCSPELRAYWEAKLARQSPQNETKPETPDEKNEEKKNESDGSNEDDA